MLKNYGAPQSPPHSGNYHKPYHHRGYNYKPAGNYRSGGYPNSYNNLGKNNGKQIYNKRPSSRSYNRGSKRSDKRSVSPRRSVSEKDASMSSSGGGLDRTKDASHFKFREGHLMKHY